MRRAIAPFVVATLAALAALLFVSPPSTAQPIPPPGLRKCTVGSAFAGDCTVAAPLELAPQACDSGSAVSGWGSDGTPTCVAAGSSLSGTTNKVAKFTSSSAIGDSSITDTGSQVTIPVLTNFSSTGAAISSSSTPSARTSSLMAAHVFSIGGTYDTTSGALTSEAGRFTVNSTRSTGSNNLTNRALYASATGAQSNIAFETNNGTNYLNASSGNTAIGYSSGTSISSKLAVNGAIAATGAISENGNRVFSVAGNGLTSTDNTVSLDTDLDLSANGTTTLGDVRCKSQEVSTTGTINDLAIGDDTCEIIFTGGSSITVNGMAGGDADRCIKVNVSTTSGAGVAITHESGSATSAAYRSNLPNNTTWTLNNNAMAFACYEASDSRWRWSLNHRFPGITVTAASSLTSAQFSGTVGLNATTNLGDAATDDIGLIGTFRRSAGDRVLGANVSGGTGAAWSVAVDGADDTTVAFDADLVSSAWTARDASWGAIAKYGDKLKFFGGAGTSAGSDVTTTFGTKRSTPSMEIDLSSSALTVNGVASFENVATFNDDFTANADAELYGTLYSYSNTLLGDADADYINARATLAFSGTNPTINSCGTGSSVTGEAQSFQVTLGTGVTSCVVNLNRTFNAAPLCVFSEANDHAQTMVGTIKPYLTSTTSTVTIVLAAIIDGGPGSPVYNVFCPDRR